MPFSRATASGWRATPARATRPCWTTASPRARSWRTRSTRTRPRPATRYSSSTSSTRPGRRSRTLEAGPGHLAGSAGLHGLDQQGQEGRHAAQRNNGSGSLVTARRHHAVPSQADRGGGGTGGCSVSQIADLDGGFTPFPGRFGAGWVAPRRPGLGRVGSWPGRPVGHAAGAGGGDGLDVGPDVDEYSGDLGVARAGRGDQRSSGPDPANGLAAFG